jgi:hypothetical protein
MEGENIHINFLQILLHTFVWNPTNSDILQLEKSEEGEMNSILLNWVQLPTDLHLSIQTHFIFLVFCMRNFFDFSSWFKKKRFKFLWKWLFWVNDFGLDNKIWIFFLEINHISFDEFKKKILLRSINFNGDEDFMMFQKECSGNHQTCSLDQNFKLLNWTENIFFHSDTLGWIFNNISIIRKWIFLLLKNTIY